ncbi:MAG: hypothetical protein A2W80_04490 [Candidatus Riflebacteria bacterium GWC2_50_8]|nr:MAG: hypothetical protein A2W80_04490 [Candidatus Riflebacteria bacterium GWC2_50_8]
MPEKIIDARGMLCPRPVMLARQALSEAAAGDILEILLDNATSCENVSRFLQGNTAQVTTATEGSIFRVKAVVAETEFCPTCAPMNFEKNPPVIAITQAGMGHGSEELGRILIQACINALPSIEPRPSAVVFYNSGIQLACEGSPVLPALEELERNGVKILVCGTCLDYFSLKEKRKVGVVSNMFEILSALAAAGHVINP